MHRLLLLIILLTPSPDVRSDEWTKVDYALLGSAMTLLVVDYRQTVDIVKSDRFHEKNPVLGKHPDRGTVDAYFAVSALGTIGISYLLPRQQRRYFLCGVVFVETMVVIRNNQLGIRAEF